MVKIAVINSNCKTIVGICRVNKNWPFFVDYAIKKVIKKKGDFRWA